MPIPYLIDTDTASDDAVALIMALKSPSVVVKAITTVSGNVPLAQCTTNALYVTEICGAADVPVYAGADRPLTRPPAHADWFHGADGLGNQNYPPPRRKPQPAHGVDAIISTIRANPGLVLVTLGPLTNIALALRKDPAIAAMVSRCVVMGGNPCCEGNVTPAAEYNIWCDPEAAREVFRSRLPIEMVGWHLCRGDANLLAPDIAHVRAIDNPLAHFTIDANRSAMEANRVQSGEIGIPLPDPTAMAIALDPSISTSASGHLVEIECDSELTRGMTVVDRLNIVRDDRNHATWAALLARGAGPNCLVHWKLNIPRWKSLLYACLQRG